MEDFEETKQRFKRVSDLIIGFETPFGMELLSTVHWVITRECDERIRNLDEVFGKVKAWSTRKAALMSREQVEAALQRLANNGWLNKLKADFKMQA
ncbi:MAG TPA: hypothetical protein VLE95_00555 [Chlamydiales bacterium]|nr:hypothetical protein [Chlamydiales bacterium]